MESKYEKPYIDLKYKLEENSNERNLVINDFIENKTISFKDKIDLLNIEEKDIRDKAKLIIQKAAKEKILKLNLMIKIMFS